ncbi:hypothetical protein AA313_de0207962 [Arthrobotrys entomopaga]|nr:hypothetical protein AA313_de0207962 [Arthrobotrys entomopaga]
MWFRTLLGKVLMTFPDSSRFFFRLVEGYRSRPHTQTPQKQVDGKLFPSGFQGSRFGLAHDYFWAGMNQYFFFCRGLGFPRALSMVGSEPPRPCPAFEASPYPVILPKRFNMKNDASKKCRKRMWSRIPQRCNMSMRCASRLEIPRRRLRRTCKNLANCDCYLERAIRPTNRGNKAGRKRTPKLDDNDEQSGAASSLA